MHYLDLTLPDPAQNLACDEALLEECEAGRMNGVLRFWEPTNYFVVAGYANHLHKEVNLPTCRARQVPVHRRCSGGGTVLQGPGCLNYALVLRAEEEGPLATITGANQFIMETHRRLSEELLGQAVQVQGFTDLTLENRKFSGNSQRRKRHCLLFHGTFLLGLHLPLISELLLLPSHAPDYRTGRDHGDFLTNIGLSAQAVKAAMQKCWGAENIVDGPPLDTLHRLVSEKYSREEWNFRWP